MADDIHAPSARLRTACVVDRARAAGTRGRRAGGGAERRARLLRRGAARPAGCSDGSAGGARPRCARPTPRVSPRGRGCPGAERRRPARTRTLPAGAATRRAPPGCAGRSARSRVQVASRTRPACGRARRRLSDRRRCTSRRRGSGLLSDLCRSAARVRRELAAAGLDPQAGVGFLDGPQHLPWAELRALLWGPDAVQRHQRAGGARGSSRAPTATGRRPRMYRPPYRAPPFDLRRLRLGDGGGVAAVLRRRWRRAGRRRVVGCLRLLRSRRYGRGLRRRSDRARDGGVQHGFCVNCGVEALFVQAVGAAYGAPVLETMRAATLARAKRTRRRHGG